VELKEWLRSLGDRARLLVIIPLVAGSVAALITLVGPSSYESSATVIVAEDPASGPITAVMAQRVADFTAAVRSDGVLDAVSRDTGVARGDVGNVTVSRSGSSGVVTITYSGTRSEEVGLVAEAIARQGLRAVAQARVDAANGEVTAARELYQAASEALVEAEAELGTSYSPRALERLQNQAIRLTQAAAAADSPADQEAALERLQQKNNRIEEMRQLDALARARDAQLVTMFAAQDRLSRANGALGAAENMDMSVTRATRTSKLQEAARRFLFVAVIGFVLALGLVILLQLMDRRREAAERGTETGPRRRPAA
jgi:capsular polysaccharide biosynthesis protein